MRRPLVSGLAVAVLAGAGVQAPAAAAPATSTTLVLSATTSAYGQGVRASAAVASTAGSPQGDVVFAVDGVEVKANLTGGGTASVLLPEAAVGAHTVVATFVPQFPDQQEPSTSPAQAWQVDPARVDVGLRVSGARPRAVARVHLDLRGDFGTVPRGEVRLRLLRGGPPPRRTRTVVLDTSGRAASRLGRLRPGRYRLVAVYRGDAGHQRARRVTRFRVGR